MANQTYIDFNINPSNPFFLHSNENPTLVLVTPLLNGKNYHSWARAMRMILESKNKIGFLDKSIPRPLPEDVLYGPWRRCNNTILYWLQRSVEESIAKSILWFDTASKLWTDLKDRFSQGDIFRIAELEEEFYHLHQGNLTISEFFTD
ncbi:PREDICTED: uncharacterized protein LOC109328178 [Lupinus angustifolius]|uniref:uncharacterized protein LOC109328178 n=1 Tax=Lupinus angustifolius TaxID=3871 RepID=UPI00092E4BB9|nr:PREDICTED: uncharacterized protein LOC109328178 [Lupinus angustifolius]